MITSAHTTATSEGLHSEGISILELSYDDRAKIVACTSDELSVALLKMGVREGDELIFRGTAPLRDPLLILVNRTKISLRKKDAAHLWVSKV